jgi:DNA-binding CsgD family transcriptional regulator
MGRKAVGVKIKITERRLKVVEMRKAGVPLQKIAKHLGCATSTVHSDLAHVISEIETQTKETTEQLITLEHLRLEIAVQVLYPKVIAGDLRAIDAWIKVSETTRKLLCLDLKFRPEKPPASPLGIDPDLCTPDELRMLLEIMQRQKETRSDEKPR